MNGRGCAIKALGAIAVVAVIAAVGTYVFIHKIRPYLYGTGCQAGQGISAVTLDFEQSADAATIAGVALRRHLPERAVVIAYATALQESKLYNLPSGDLDSVGIFQQRPSEGWGPAADLENPVYASQKFFDALVKVPRYTKLPVAIAAQDVQRSADGSAYAEHVLDAQTLADAFTGTQPAGFHCWYPPDKEKPTSEVAQAITALHQAVGPHARPDGDAVTVSDVTAGWSVAMWLAANAQTYGLREISFDGKHWQSGSGHDGWTDQSSAPSGSIALK